MLVVDSLRKSIFADASATAIIDGNNKYSYLDFAAEIEKIYQFLKNQVHAGDRVGLLYENSAQFLFCQYACMLSGAIAVPFDANISSRNFKYIMSDCEVGVLLGSGELLQQRKNDLSSFQSTLRTVLSDVKEIDLKQEVINFNDLEETNGSLDFKENVDPDSVAVILYTSGTTGDPKGVCLTHKNMMAATENINLRMGLGHGVKEVVPIPLSHSFGMGRTRCVFAKGGSVILEKGFLRPDKVVQSIIEHRANGFSSVPAGFSILLKKYKEIFKKCADSLEYVEVGSAFMSQEIKQTLLSMFPKTRFFLHYGLTEASRSAFLELPSEINKSTSVGLPPPNVHISIKDDYGKDLANGESGNIYISADTVMKGYWRNEEETKKVLDDSWLNTRDIGRLDEDGYLYLEGRQDDIVNIGGLKVSSVEVEKTVNQLKGVLESAAIGIEDREGLSGWVLKLFVVRKTEQITGEKIRKYCLQNLESWKVPRFVVFVAELPKTSSGKIQKNILSRNTN